MDIIKDFMNTYGSEIIYTVLMAVFSFVGIKIKSIYERYINNNIKKNIVEDTVKYVEQVYKELSSTKKFNKAKENIITLLDDKGIHITELELKVLIESAVNSFNNHTNKELNINEYSK